MAPRAPLKRLLSRAAYAARTTVVHAKERLRHANHAWAKKFNKSTENLPGFSDSEEELEDPPESDNASAAEASSSRRVSSRAPTPASNPGSQSQSQSQPPQPQLFFIRGRPLSAHFRRAGEDIPRDCPVKKRNDNKKTPGDRLLRRVAFLPTISEEERVDFHDPAALDHPRRPRYRRGTNGARRLASDFQSFEIHWTGYSTASSRAPHPTYLHSQLAADPLQERLRSNSFSLTDTRLLAVPDLVLPAPTRLRNRASQVQLGQSSRQSAQGPAHQQQQQQQQFPGGQQQCSRPSLQLQRSGSGSEQTLPGPGLPQHHPSGLQQRSFQQQQQRASVPQHYPNAQQQHPGGQQRYSVPSIQQHRPSFSGQQHPGFHLQHTSNGSHQRDSGHSLPQQHPYLGVQRPVSDPGTQHYPGAQQEHPSPGTQQSFSRGTQQQHPDPGAQQQRLGNLPAQDSATVDPTNEANLGAGGGGNSIPPSL